MASTPAMDETSGSAGATPDHKELGLWTKFATSIRKVDFTMGAILQCDGMGGGRYSTHARRGSTVGSSNRAPGCLGSAAASGCHQAVPRFSWLVRRYARFYTTHLGFWF